MNPEIILIDDDEILLVILEKMIKKIMGDIAFKAFNSGTNALEYLKNTSSDATKKRFLLVDINLKDMTGWDFLTQIEKVEKNKFKAIVMTSSVSLSNPTKAEKFPSVIGFFEKPITFQSMEKMSNLILNRVE